MLKKNFTKKTLVPAVLLLAAFVKIKTTGCVAYERIGL